jgi:hypothetical protein
MELLGVLQCDETDAIPRVQMICKDTGVDWRYHHDISTGTGIHDPNDPAPIIALSKQYLDLLQMMQLTQNFCGLVQAVEDMVVFAQVRFFWHLSVFLVMRIAHNDVG